jgi:hypothetical protein
MRPTQTNPKPTNICSYSFKAVLFGGEAAEKFIQVKNKLYMKLFVKMENNMLF